MNSNRKHIRAFQENVVRLAMLPDRSIAAVAVRLGIPVRKLRSWVRKSKDELIKLRNELKQAHEEIEILKKANGKCLYSTKYVGAAREAPAPDFLNALH